MTRANHRHRREQRRKDAEERQAVHDSLTVDEKIAKALSRPGFSKKELTRLGYHD